MKIILIAALVGLSAPCVANDQQNEQDKYQYRGSSGTEYQYDLSRPADKNKYELDIGAQIRDQLNVDPRRELDRDRGQSGGGVKR